MKWNEVFCDTYKSIGREVGLDVQMVEGYLICTPLDPDDPRYSTDFILPSMKMVEACRASEFDFFQPWLSARKLTEEQMHHAADRYHLGKTKSGQSIFWMIDDMQNPLDAHIGHNWISTLLKKREPLLEYWKPTHCLFGLHLLSERLTKGCDIPLRKHSARGGTTSQRSALPLATEGTQELFERNNAALSSKNLEKTVSIVESETSAVVLSELFPESIWMAYASTAHLTPDLFAPLEGHTVTIYPRSDPTLSTYLFFKDLADLTRRQYGLDLNIDTTLEDHATASQKERCIDILEFLQDSL